MTVCLISILPNWHSGKESASQGRRCKRHRFDPWAWKIPWRRKWQPTPIFLPRKSQGQRSLVGYSPRGCKESDTTEHTHTYRTDLNILGIYYLLHKVWGGI